jgi:hypothetical protein
MGKSEVTGHNRSCVTSKVGEEEAAWVVTREMVVVNGLEGG